MQYDELKTYLGSSMGQQRVSNITFINNERAYGYPVIMTWISSAAEMPRTAISFNVLYKLISC